jgi:hypothetical protein
MSYKRKLKYEKIMEVSLGEYRLFISVGKFSEKMAFGLPLDNCKNKKVWVEENGDSKYLSSSKAKKLLYKALGNTAYGQLKMNPKIRGLI